MVRRLLGCGLAAVVSAQDLFLSPQAGEPTRFDWGDSESPLDTYMNKPDPHYGWFDTGERVKMALGGTGYLLNVTSQAWRNEDEAYVEHNDGFRTSVWSHQVLVIVPDKLKIRNKAAIYNTGGCNEHPGIPKATDEEPLFMNAVSEQTGAITVALFQIPNCHMVYPSDPSGKRRSEDAMIAWAWKEFMDSGDPEWLPHLPMAKAVMKAMQAVQEFTTQESIAEIDGWLVAGASKRGWTTWMVGAANCPSCPNVEALAPIVPIVPNLREGVHHMWRAYGGFSFAFNDYTAVNFTTQIDSDGIKELFKICDPMAYISRLEKIPKTVVCSSDDEFMMMEWTANWFDDFNKNGEMNLWIGANVEHSMATGVVGLEKTLGNYANSVFLGGKRPKFSHNLDKTNGEITVQIPADQAHGKVVLRHGHTLSHKQRDFRWVSAATEGKDGNDTCVAPRVGPFSVMGSNACIQPIIWKGTTLNETSPGVYVAKIPTPKIGWVGAFVEVFFPSDTGLSTEYQFTTPGMVWPQTLPFDDCHAEECVPNLL